MSVSVTLLTDEPHNDACVTGLSYPLDQVTPGKPILSHMTRIALPGVS